jgi:hypothetical protein
MASLIIEQDGTRTHVNLITGVVGKTPFKAWVILELLAT